MKIYCGIKLAALILVTYSVSRAAGKALQAQILSGSNNFAFKWNDEGSGGDHDGSFFHPKPPSGFWALGSFGQSGYGSARGQVIVVKALESGALAHPKDYSRIWKDSGSGADRDGSFWRPIPESGYVCMGIVAQNGYGKPSNNDIMCVRSDLTSNGKLGNFVWDDSDTGADDDFGSWMIAAGSDDCVAPGTFVGVASHDSNAAKSQVSSLIKCLKVDNLQTAAGPTRQELDALIGRFGPKVYFHSDEQYVMTGVEWFLQRANLLTKASGATVQATTENLPQGESNEDKYQLVLKSSESRPGDLSTAKAYVHAKSLPFSTDIQFWFFYAYNGPGTARVKSLAFDTTVNSGNPSLAPLGEHEGDWEHITIRINNKDRDIEKVFMSQHAGGQWLLPGSLEREGEKVVVYSSKNGHASYPNAGGHYSEHRKWSSGWAGGFGLEFWLRNDCNKGRSIDCSANYQLVSAPYLSSNKPTEPKWLKFYGRWGASNHGQTISKDAVKGIIEGVAGSLLGEALSSSRATDLATMIAAKYAKEDQDGPSAPISKGAWTTKQDET